MESRKFDIPETLDALLSSLEDPHIPPGERLLSDTDEHVEFKNEEAASEVLSIKLGVVPEWLEQTYKSKFARKKVSSTEKEEREKKKLEEMKSQKRKATNDAMDSMLETIKAHPGPEANLQDRRDWDNQVMTNLGRLLSSPRAKKKVQAYVAKRQKTEREPMKKSLVKHLTNLKEDGGMLDGGKNKETYNHKLLQKVAKKAQKKEEAKKAEGIKKLKKMAAVQKMIATVASSEGPSGPASSSIAPG